MGADGAQPEQDFVSGFAPEIQGQRAECDGGAPIAGTRFAGRQDFAGTLTGHYRDYGKYAWRWVLLSDLTKKPEGYAHEAVWCDADSLYLPGTE
ncbi:MAG: hypothetical protein RL695_389 [Pseudomonadota bacterium]